MKGEVKISELCYLKIANFKDFKIFYFYFYYQKNCEKGVTFFHEKFLRENFPRENFLPQGKNTVNDKYEAWNYQTRGFGYNPRFFKKGIRILFQPYSIQKQKKKIFQ